MSGFFTFVWPERSKRRLVTQNWLFFYVWSKPTHSVKNVRGVGGNAPMLRTLYILHARFPAFTNTKKGIDSVFEMAACNSAIVL